MRRTIIILLLTAWPVSTKAIDFVSMRILNRQVPPPVFIYGDSIIDIDYGIFGLRCTVTDSNGTIGRSYDIEPTPDNDDYPISIIPLGNGWFDVVANRYVEQREHYCWPYLYQFNTSDTGFVEERFHNIDLPEYCTILDAKPIRYGGFLILYTYGGNSTWWKVSRVMEDGDVVWTETIMENPVNGMTRSHSIHPSFRFSTIFYILSSKSYFPQGPMYAHLTAIHFSGDTLWTREYRWPGRIFGFALAPMVSFSDGTYGIIGSGANTLHYLHITGNGDILGTYTYYTGEAFGGHINHLVIGGDRLLILTNFEHNNLDSLGLIYLSEDGDSLDGYYFHPDTVDDVGTMLLRPDGKVMLWMSAGSAITIPLRRQTDILYTFYPDGRPGAVADDKRDTYPTLLSLSAFPNPFNSQATISFMTSGDAYPTRLQLFDPLGRKIDDLIPTQSLNQGSHTFLLDGAALPAGTYLIRLEAGGSVKAGNVTLVK